MFAIKNCHYYTFVLDQESDVLSNPTDFPYKEFLITNVQWIEFQGQGCFTLDPYREEMTEFSLEEGVIIFHNEEKDDELGRIYLDYTADDALFINISMLFDLDIYHEAKTCGVEMEDCYEARI